MAGTTSGKAHNFDEHGQKPMWSSTHEEAPLAHLAGNESLRSTLKCPSSWSSMILLAWGMPGTSGDKTVPLQLQLQKSKRARAHHMGFYSESSQ
jgi:hypothetical protein